MCFLTESKHLKLKDKLAAYDWAQMPVGYLTSSKVWSRIKTGDNDILSTFVLDTFMSKLEDFHQHIDHHLKRRTQRQKDQRTVAACHHW